MLGFVAETITGNLYAIGVVLLFLHIGGMYYIKVQDIICIFDIKKSDNTAVRDFIKKAECENRLFYACDKEKTGSVVVVRKGNKYVLYMAGASAVSMGRKRCVKLKAK